MIIPKFGIKVKYRSQQFNPLFMIKFEMICRRTTIPNGQLERDEDILVWTAILNLHHISKPSPYHHLLETTISRTTPALTLPSLYVLTIAIPGHRRPHTMLTT